MITIKKLILYLVPLFLLAGIIGFKLNKDESVLESPSKVSAATVDYFLKLPGVEGESDRNDELEILSWSWGTSESGGLVGLPAVQGGGAGKISYSDFNFSMKTNKASPILMQSSASGKMFEVATLYGIKRGEGDHQFLKIHLKPVYITSYQTGGSGGEIPTDSFSLNFTQIKYEYTPQKEDGSAGDTVEGSWDFEKNTTVE